MKIPWKESIKNRAGVDLSEKGFVLILALVAMLAMTIIGISLVMNMSTDMQLARNERESKQAFQLAEAGVNEAVARLRLPTINPLYIGEPAAVMTAYRTTAAWAGDAFDSGTSADGLNYAVTIEYLTEQEIFHDSVACSAGATRNISVGGACVGGLPATDGYDGEVVMYGQDFNICNAAIVLGACTGSPASRFGTYPVYKIISVGTENTTDRTIEAYVGASDLNIDTLGAINTNDCISVSGGAGNIENAIQGGVCACDAIINGGAGCDAKAGLDEMISPSILTGSSISELASTADYQIQCATKNECNADIADVPDDMWGDCAGDTTSKLIYIKQTAGALTPSPTITGIDLGAAACGRGILIVEGNIEFGGGFRWEGLVYVVGEVGFAGGGAGVNIQGGVMANNAVQVSGGIDADYDLATLQEVGRQAGSAAKTYISWKRK
ncbi:MAG: hypothetical protein A3J24_00470 [Deltaproteobacteria bacterium RIFCSPLOWO2_02_FULL_53_8]|nr:MAG: hypothetical protein A3J24_00470 [Deltaproteobacteria bacterium RIFCSPLOWO2_02_FULL_53_8]